MGPPVNVGANVSAGRKTPSASTMAVTSTAMSSASKGLRRRGGTGDVASALEPNAKTIY